MRVSPREGELGAEKEKMLRGELYKPFDDELASDHRRCHALLGKLNSLPVEAQAERFEVLEGLLGGIGSDSEVKSPFRCDYGYNIELGSGVFVNYGCVFLDTGRIVIGDGTQIGPSVHVYAADHPRDPRLRREQFELSRPVMVEENVWIGGGAIVCPGVRVGRNSVVGAGSVVAKDIPPNVIAAGNPCRQVRTLEN